MEKKTYNVREHIIDGDVIHTDHWTETVCTMDEAIVGWIAAVHAGDYHTGDDPEAEIDVEAYFELLDIDTDEVVAVSNIVCATNTNI